MLLKITALTANTAVSINMLLITASTHEQIQTKSVNLQKHPETSDTVCAPSVGASYPENHRHHAIQNHQHQCRDDQRYTSDFKCAYQPETSSPPFSSLIYASHSQKICGSRITRLTSNISVNFNMQISRKHTTYRNIDCSTKYMTDRNTSRATSYSYHCKWHKLNRRSTYTRNTTLTMKNQVNYYYKQETREHFFNNMHRTLNPIFGTRNYR